MGHRVSNRAHEAGCRPGRGPRRAARPGRRPTVPPDRVRGWAARSWTARAIRAAVRAASHSPLKTRPRAPGPREARAVGAALLPCQWRAPV